MVLAGFGAVVGLALAGCALLSPPAGGAAALPVTVIPITEEIAPLSDPILTPSPPVLPGEAPSQSLVDPTGENSNELGDESLLPNPPTPAPSPTRLYYAQGPYYFPAGINPLTGLEVADPALLERRPIVVKVTNFPRSVRPQWGLSLADHVYEYYIGDSMSRFIGVFYGQDAVQAGPIRSARIFDAHIMRMYNGVFVFGYADDPVLEFFNQPDTKNRLIVERDNNCPPLCRIGPQAAYNNLFIDTSQVAAYLKSRRNSNPRPDLGGLRFERDIPKSGNPGLGLAAQYSLVSYSRWAYDPASARYLRFQEVQDDRGERAYAPLTDSLTGLQLSADNVIVLFVRHEYFLKSSSTEIIDQPILGSGRGYAFRDGLLYPVEWRHAAADQMLSLYLPNNRFYPLKPGVTWFIVLGESSALGQGVDGQWQFQFGMP
jgi:hypothetical protein